MHEYHFMREVAAVLCPSGHYKTIILDSLILKSVSQNIYEKVIYILSYPILLLYLYLCLQFSFLIPVHYFYTFCICVCFLTTKNLSNTCQQFKCFFMGIVLVGTKCLSVSGMSSVCFALYSCVSSMQNVSCLFQYTYLIF